VPLFGCSIAGWQSGFNQGRLSDKRDPGRDVVELGLLGKAALVTGASRGLGEAIALELASEGVQVCLTARDEARLARVAGAIGARFQTRCTVFAGDLRGPETVRAVVMHAVATFGRLDILVNNAGATQRGDFFALTEENWQDGYALKFHGYVRATRAAWPHLRGVGGSVINIVGIGARYGSDDFTIGGSVNAALLNFTKAMARIGMRDGVRVNALNPGRIETDRLARTIARHAQEDGTTQEEARAALLAACGTARFGKPEEIAAAVAFLASERAAFVQGALIDIDGGENKAL
jgi:NAD(P)-dependent dehydrogenase (short-subunit alcohol dehydrogenase family)